MRQALDADPSSYAVYSNRSASYLKKGEHDNALKDAQRCVEIAPDWAKGYGRLGAALFALSRFDEAEAAYRTGMLFSTLERHPLC